MKIFGIEIRKANDPGMISSPQIRATNPQGIFTSIFQDYIFRKVSGDFYEKIREAIPLIDAAIIRKVALMGTIKIIGDNADCVKELEDFNLSVPVNDTQEGIHAWWQNIWDETYEQGNVMSEYITTPDMKDIAGLRIADSKNIIFRRNAAGAAEPWLRYSNNQSYGYTMPASLIQQILTATYGQIVSFAGWDEVKLNPANKIYLSINNENNNPYGTSILRSMEWSSQILCTIENSIKNTAERYGDPMHHVHLKHKTSDLEKVRKLVEDDFKVIINSKRAGGSGDLVTASGPDGDTIIKVIGHDGQVMDYTVSLAHVKENLTAKLLPAWMLGIRSNTDGKIAMLEVESVLQDAKVSQLLALPKLLKLYSIVLKLRGKKWNNITTSLDKPGDWGVIFEIPNLRDMLSIANANFLNAQADMMRSGVATNVQTNVTAGQASLNSPLIKGDKGGCSCKSHPDKNNPRLSATPFTKGESTKELRRPRPWPELDKVEADFESALVYDWRELKNRVLGIATAGTKAQKTGTEGQRHKGTEEIPNIDTFTFTEEQRAAVMKALEDHLGIYSLDDPDSPVTWAYGQSYSLGLIRAAEMIGDIRSAKKSAIPILDIIKNKEIFDEMRRTGFALIKDKATVEVNKAIDFMEEGMLRGLNPKQVAADLAKLFDNKEYDWERLARSEMSMAAERAKLNEWGAWGVKMVEFTPAPDACPICFSVAGEYEIGKCPVPVDSTHPNCRCSIQPAQSEVDG